MSDLYPTIDDVRCTDDGDRLTITVSVPDDMSESDRSLVIRSVTWIADELHRMLGGHGLVVETIGPVIQEETETR